MTDQNPSRGSAVVAAETALANIERWNPKTNAMLLVMADEARRTAEALDAMSARGGWGGLLHGVTISLKDNIDVAGYRTTAASKLLKNNVAARDAFVVERLRRNGAIIVGKANLHEWCFGPTSQSRHFGPCRNPWNADHVPGGSSGGSGASVAAGMCIGSIGSDTAGSVRMPASFNGVAGLRPTAGRVSNRGSIEVSPAYDTLGPLAKRVSDVARIFAAIAAYDPEDPISVDRPGHDVLSRLNEPAGGMRIGFLRRWSLEGVDGEVGAAVEAALAAYRALGVEIVEIDLGDIERSFELFGRTVCMADGYHTHKERMAAHPEDYGEDVFSRLLIGARVTGEQYAEGLRWAERFRLRLRTAFRHVDAILTPTTPVPAPRADIDFAQAIRDLPRFVCAAPSVGVPALSVPCGFSAAGLPLSFQLTAPWFGEETLFRLGHAYQGVTDHHLRTPAPPGAEVDKNSNKSPQLNLEAVVAKLGGR
ncbi:MAG: hypothetical protein JWQ36_3415 [Enterovirga sp.]|nr:hypothetical protein [Enterovirga sp.]